MLHPTVAIKSDMSDGNSLELFYIASGSEYFSQISCNRADVGTVRDLYLTDKEGPRIGNNSKSINSSFFGLDNSFFFSFSSQFIGSLPIYPDSTIHRRGLQDISCEIFLNNSFNNFSGESVNCFLLYFQHLYRVLEIIRRRRPVESYTCFVGFWECIEEGEESGRSVGSHYHETCRERIQGSCEAYFWYI